MPTLLSHLRRNAARYALLLLALVLSATFTGTLSLRAPWFASLGQDNTGLEALTGTATRITREWAIYGPLAEGFGLLTYPRSVAAPTLKSRTPITSYGSGFVYPLYLLSLVPGIQISPAWVMGYNLFTQWAIALLLAGMLFRLLQQSALPMASAFCFSLIPPLAYLLLPAPLFFHQNIYWADMAVLLPFFSVIALELEFKRQGKPPFGGFHTLMAALLFWGASTEWIFFLLLIPLWIGRLKSPKQEPRYLLAALKEALRLGLPCALALAIFAFQLFTYGDWRYLLMRFLDRSRIAAQSYTSQKTLLNSFLGVYMPTGLGPLAPTLFCLSLLIPPCAWGIQRALRKKIRATLLINAAALLLIPPLLHTLILREHAATHPFSIIKFIPGIALSVGVLGPLLFLTAPLEKLFQPPPLIRAARFSIAALSLGLSLLYLAHAHTGYKTLFNNHGLTSDAHYAFLFSNTGYAHCFKHFGQGKPAPCPIFQMTLKDPTLDYPAIGRFIDAHTDSRDLLFSQDIVTPIMPGQMIGYSLQCIYPLATLLDIYARARPLDADWRISIFSLTEEADWCFGLPGLLKQSAPIRHETGWRLYQVEKKDFLTYCDRLKEHAPQAFEHPNQLTIPVFSYEEWKKLSLPGWREVRQKQGG